MTSVAGRWWRRAWEQRGFLGNLGALVGSLGSLALATLLVAWAGGPGGVGVYALLRILPWLFAIIVSAGLSNAISYFLAGPTRDDPRVRPTIAVIMLGAGLIAVALWCAAAPLVRLVFLQDVALLVVLAAASKVASRLVVITAKGACQGCGDTAGMNLGILLEELLFLPAYGLLVLLGWSGPSAIVAGLVLADIVTGLVLAGRLARLGFFAGWAAPSRRLARRIIAFGIKGQAGNLMTLLNLRLDFLLIGALLGPATLGVYSIASKYAELVRLLPIAINWMLYPRFARDEPADALSRARRLLPALGGVTALSAIPFFLLAGPVIPFLYGGAFEPAVVPAHVLFVGLAGEGVGAVIVAFLLGRGRPGLASIASGCGLAVTAMLDVLLIPRWGVLGAALTSTVVYLLTDVILLAFFVVLSRPGGVLPVPEPVLPGLPSRSPGAARRTLDIAIAAFGLAVMSPVLALGAVAARASTGASAIYRQQRVGQGGVPFTLYKFRSMRPGGGPDITTPDDARVTRVGRLLRASSFDEVPQLLNVLRGDMTLVGPRPESVRLALRYPERYRAIFAYRPGLTGPTQIRMRDVPSGLLDVEAYYLRELVPWRVLLDLEYLEDPTLLRTLEVLFQTADYVLGFVPRRQPPRREQRPVDDRQEALQST